MKNTDNIVALNDEELNNVQGGLLLATAVVCTLGTSILGSACGILCKNIYDTYKEYKTLKSEKKKAAEQNVA